MSGKMAFALHRFLIFLIFTGHLRNFVDSAAHSPHRTIPNIVLPPDDGHSINAPKSPVFSIRTFNSIAGIFDTDGRDVDSVAGLFRGGGMGSSIAPSYAETFISDLNEYGIQFLEGHGITNEKELLHSLREANAKR